MHLDFDAARREHERVAGEPLTFTLGGQTFTCLDVTPVGIYVDVVDAGMSNLALVNFVLGCVVPDDEQRLRDLLRAKKDPRDPPKRGEKREPWRPIGGDDLWPIFNALTDALTGRPTERSTDSSDGPPTTTPSSNGTSSTPVIESEPSST